MTEARRTGTGCPQGPHRNGSQAPPSPFLPPRAGRIPTRPAVPSCGGCGGSRLLPVDGGISSPPSSAWARDVPRRRIPPFDRGSRSAPRPAPALHPGLDLGGTEGTVRTGNQLRCRRRSRPRRVGAARGRGADAVAEGGSSRETGTPTGAAQRRQCIRPLRLCCSHPSVPGGLAWTADPRPGGGRKNSGSFLVHFGILFMLW